MQMIDHYTKIVLTVIACSLVALVAQNFIHPAIAQSGQECGGIRNPCYITAYDPLEVKIHDASMDHFIPRLPR